MKTRILNAALAGVFTCSIIAASAQNALQEQARQLSQEKGESVLWLSAVMKMSMTASGGSDSPMNVPDRERKVEALATVIDSSGLIVTALSNVDPSREVEGREFNTPQGPMRFDVAVTLKEVKVVLQDGTEIPAEQVMKDSDLDLAFFRVKTDSKEAKDVKFKALDLKQSGQVKLSDDAITLSRTEDTLNRVPVVTRGQVTSITEKPRRFVRVTGANPGCPTFNAEGKLIGLGVNRFVRNKASVLVVLPAADVEEIAQQAAKAKPIAQPAEEEKSDAEKSSEPKSDSDK